MKKERNLLVTIIILLVAYIVMLFFLPGFRDDWFSFVLYFMSIYMFLKAYFFRSDSSLFFAVLFFQSTFLFLGGAKDGLSIFQLGSIINAMIASAFFICFLFFHSKFTLYSFLTNFSLSLPVLLYSFNCINLILMILFLCGALLLSIAIIFSKNEKI